MLLEGVIHLIEGRETKHGAPFYKINLTVETSKISSSSFSTLTTLLIYQQKFYNSKKHLIFF